MANPVVDDTPGPPTPVKTSQKKDDHHAVPQVSRVTDLPPPKGQISGSATVSILLPVAKCPVNHGRVSCQLWPSCSFAELRGHP